MEMIAIRAAGYPSESVSRLAIFAVASVLFVAPDRFLASRAVQFATLAREKVCGLSKRDMAAVGGLMGYF